MKKYTNTAILLFSSLLLLIFAACSLDSDYSGVSVTDSELSSHRTDTFSSDTNNQGINGITVGWSTTVGTTTEEEIVLTFSDTTSGVCEIDESTLSGVHFYNLGGAGTDETDGAPLRDGELPTTSYTLEFYGSTTVVTYVVDLSVTTSYSAWIEVYIDPTVLTANDGNLKLNYDGDGTHGEASDDDYIGYITGLSGTAVTGSSRVPRLDIQSFLTAFGIPAAGDTSITISYDFNAASYTTSSPISKTLLDAYYTIQMFNPVTCIWENFSITLTNYTDNGDGTADYVINFAALDAGDFIRLATSDPYGFATTSTVFGYTARVDFDQARTIFIDTTATPIAGTKSGFSGTFNPAAIAVTYTSEIYDASTTDEYKMVYELDFSAAGLGAEGLSETTITTSNLKLYDATDNVYIPWSSITLEDSNTGTANNDIVTLTMNPGYKNQGHTLEIHIGPGLYDLGATTATTDDVRLGDWTNTTTFPLGFNIDTTVGGNTI